MKHFERNRDSERVVHFRFHSVGRTILVDEDRYNVGSWVGGVDYAAIPDDGAVSDHEIGAGFAERHLNALVDFRVRNHQNFATLTTSSSKYSDTFPELRTRTHHLVSYRTQLVAVCSVLLQTLAIHPVEHVDVDVVMHDRLVLPLPCAVGGGALRIEPQGRSTTPIRRETTAEPVVIKSFAHLADLFSTPRRSQCRGALDQTASRLVSLLSRHD